MFLLAAAPRWNFSKAAHCRAWLRYRINNGRWIMSQARTAIIAGNWKMNYGPRQASSFAMEILPALGHLLRQPSNALCILCPPSISLEAVHEVMEAMTAPHIELGAQNMHFEEQG